MLRRFRQLAEQRANLRRAHATLCLSKQHGKQRQADHLAQEALRGRNCDFLVRFRVNHAVALTRHGAAHHIRNAEHFRALHARIANGGQRVGRFA